MKIHLKQQNNLLINKIWTTENCQQEATSGSKSFRPVLGNKKKIPTKVPVKFCTLIGCTAHYVTASALELKEHNFCYYCHYVVCYAFQSQAVQVKSEKYASFVIAILII